MLSLKNAFLISLLSLSSVIAQKNVTVDHSDPSIQYSGSATGSSPVCKVDERGLVISGQAGCYNSPSQCTDSFAAGQKADAAAEFKFKGSAIYITGFLDFLSPIYTVTLDGKSTDVDGVRPSGPFICSPLFSSTNLDPNVEHTLQLSVKGASPNRNMTIDSDGTNFTFGLVNLIYTEGAAVSNSTTSSTATSATSSNASSTTSTNSTTSATSIPSSKSGASHTTAEASFTSMILVSAVLVALAGLA